MARRPTACRNTHVKNSVNYSGYWMCNTSDVGFAQHVRTSPEAISSSLKASAFSISTDPVIVFAWQELHVPDMQA